MSKPYTRILEELHPEVHANPMLVLEYLMIELKWAKRMRDRGAINPLAQIRIPKNPHLLLPETLSVELRWYRKVGRGQTMRCGANMEPFTDTEVKLLSRAALKERMENWFCQVVERI